MERVRAFGKAIVTKPSKQDAVAAAYKTSGAGSNSGARYWQLRLSHFYGDPAKPGDTGVGEVRFAVGWISHQVGRLGWRVMIDGEALDTATSDAYVRLVSDRAATQQIAANLAMFGELCFAAYPAGGLPVITGNSSWGETTATTTDISIVGPVYAGDGDLRWRVVSVVDSDRHELLDKALTHVTGLVPHPADPTMPDSVMSGVLSVLEEIEQLTLLTRAQNRSRLSQIGILGVASELSISSDASHNAPDDATGVGTDDFAEMLQEAVSAPMQDPENTGATPILLRVPTEMLASGGWARWLQMSHTYDELLAQRLKFAIQRLAYGLPVPPEILLGMASANRAVAFQVEEASYREHIEPFAAAVGAVYGAALAHMLDLPDDSTVEFVPDPTALLARQHSVEDAFAAWEKGLVSAKWVRSVLGIPEEEASTEDDLRRLAATSGAQPPRDDRSAPDGSSEVPIDGEPTEGARPSREPVAASLSDEPPVVLALRTAIQMAVVRAREKVGAKIRTAVRDDADLTAQIHGTMNCDVAAALGQPIVTAHIEEGTTVLEAMDGLGKWWTDYVGEPGGSVGVLEELAASLALDRLYLPGSAPIVPDDLIAEVLASI